MKKISLTRILLLLLTLCTSSIMAKSASVLLREGLYAEEVEGDLSAAIKVYQQVIDDKNAQDNLVAQALYRQGMCHMKLQNEPEAKAAFSKLLANHADQTTLVEKVRPLLEELGNADPANLMPPNTIMYIEIGSPGKQIETILSMLKGTPFENPLAMIGDNMNQETGGQPNPANMIGALFNPSMMAEFRKIRGMGIGITGIAKGTPPGVVVLYPGQSDALRGLLVAALSMAGRPAEPIEGMKVVTLPEGGAAAYDDTVVIMTSPTDQTIDQLRWSAKQYKGMIAEPSLASSNKSFAKISKRARQDNALTLWLNINETYQGLMSVLPPDEVPQQLHMANGLVDFKNVDDVIASISLGETGLALEANLNLKEGHNCMAYNMIHTPHLSRDALKAVPTEAVALVSLALGQPGTPQADAVGQQIANATGMDIGADLFNNIDQITLFATPTDAPAPGEQVEGQIPPQAKTLGLAITSADPQKTHEFLTTALQSTEMLTSASEPVDGKFDLTVAENVKIFGHLDQADKTILLSLDPDLIASSRTAMKQSEVGGSVLQGALRTLPDNTSKLVMLSIAGIIRSGARNTNISDGKLAEQIKGALAQLAQATEKTTIRLQTTEEANSFGIRLSVTDLPPVGQLFGPLMQIKQAWSQVEAQAKKWDTPQAPPAGIAPAKKTPAIDGRVDACWANAQTHDLKNSYYGAPSSDADLSASFKTLFDKNNLYILVEVADDDLQNDSDEFWLDDAIEVFIDADNSRQGSYDDNDFQYHFGWDASSPVLGESQHGNMRGIEAAFAETNAGYRAEIKLPWATLGTRPAAGTPIGLDVQVNDDDGGGDRDSKIAWHAPQDDAYVNPRAFGAAQPLGLVGWWKLDERTGDTAADASGNGRTGRLVGEPTWQPSAGKRSGALELDGQDDYMDTGYATDSPTWTVAAWVKSPSAPSDDKQTGPVHREKNYQINWDHMLDQFRGGAAVCVAGTWHAASFGSLRADTWYHLAATYDGQTLKAFKNGAIVTENADPSGAPDAEGQTLKLGRHAMNADCFHGTIDDVRLYNHALGSAEIRTLAGK